MLLWTPPPRNWPTTHPELKAMSSTFQWWMSREDVFPACVVTVSLTVLLVLLLKHYVTHRVITATAAWQSHDLRSVNYHFLRQCNYECKYCFHQDINQPRTRDLITTDWQRGLRMLQQAGMQKINFSGGEPFLKPRLLGKMVRFSKVELGVVTGIISNGSRITKQWMQEYGPHLDWLGISFDSFDPQTLSAIGRRSKSAKQPEVDRACVQKIRSWCDSFNIRFKINTVVSRFNHAETMSESILELKPERWKVFQALSIEEENAGPDVLRNAQDSLVSAEEFEAFIARNQQANPIAESNDVMRNSYVLVDEQFRFLNNSGGKKQPGPPILKEGVETAFKNINFDDIMFRRRLGDSAVVGKVGDSAVVGKVPNQLADIEDLVQS